MANVILEVARATIKKREEEKIEETLSQNSATQEYENIIMQQFTSALEICKNNLCEFIQCHIRFSKKYEDKYSIECVLRKLGFCIKQLFDDYSSEEFSYCVYVPKYRKENNVSKTKAQEYIAYFLKDLLILRQDAARNISNHSKYILYKLQNDEYTFEHKSHKRFAIYVEEARCLNTLFEAEVVEKFFEKYSLYFSGRDKKCYVLLIEDDIIGNEIHDNIILKIRDNENKQLSVEAKQEKIKEYKDLILKKFNKSLQLKKSNCEYFQYFSVTLEVYKDYNMFEELVKSLGFNILKAHEQTGRIRYELGVPLNISYERMTELQEKVKESNLEVSNKIIEKKNEINRELNSIIQKIYNGEFEYELGYEEGLKNRREFKIYIECNLSFSKKTEKDMANNFFNRYGLKLGKIKSGKKLEIIGYLK